MRKIKLHSVGGVMALAAAGLLAACGAEPEEKSYEVDATDQSGGELIVSDVDPEAVPVDTPDTEMVSVPEGEAADGTEEGEPEASE